MSRFDVKADLHRYLDMGRDALLWKLEGLSEYDLRRPLVPTGTNLLGLVKHLAGVESGYFGMVFDRPFPQPLPWMSPEAEPNADMWATEEESPAQILALFDRVRAHADATIADLDIDATGRVPWWGAHGEQVTLGTIMIHVTTETHRHAGHADLVRELIDGSAGFRDDALNLPSADAAWWARHRDRLEEVARHAGAGGGERPTN